MQLDSLDLRILRERQANASLSSVALAQRVHPSPSPYLARVRALERFTIEQLSPMEEVEKIRSSFALKQVSNAWREGDGVGGEDVVRHEGIS